MKRLFNISSVLMILAFILIGCGRSAPTQPNKFSAFTYAQALEFKELYTTTYRQETSQSAAFEIWWAYNSTAFGQLKDMQFLSDNCYENVNQVLQDATIGIYDTNHADDGAPTTGIIDRDQMFSALVTNNLYPANADRCSEILQDSFDQVVVIRTKSFEYQVAFIEQKRVTDNLYNDEISKAAGKRFLDLYGQEFLSYANSLLENGGVEPFPTDFIGFPTSGMSAKTKDVDWYNYYLAIYNGEAPVPDNRFSNEMYMVIWKGPANKGEATLYRQAAWEFQDRSFRYEAVESAVNCGEGMPGLSEDTQSDCETNK